MSKRTSVATFRAAVNLVGRRFLSFCLAKISCESLPPLQLIFFCPRRRHPAEIPTNDKAALGRRAFGPFAGLITARVLAQHQCTQQHCPALCSAPKRRVLLAIGRERFFFLFLFPLIKQLHSVLFSFVTPQCLAQRF